MNSAHGLTRPRQIPRFDAPFPRMELPQLGGLTEQSWIVPNRNAIFLSVAVNVACQAGADTVTIGCNKADAEYFPDSILTHEKSNLRRPNKPTARAL